MLERTYSNACYGVGEEDGGEGGATTERIVSNCGKSFGQGDGEDVALEWCPRLIVILIVCHSPATFDGEGFGVGVVRPCEVVATGAAYDIRMQGYAT